MGSESNLLRSQGSHCDDEVMGTPFRAAAKDKVLATAALDLGCVNLLTFARHRDALPREAPLRHEASPRCQRRLLRNLCRRSPHRIAAATHVGRGRVQYSPVV